MRVFASALAASLALSSAADAAPQRVASLKLCTDEILLMLAEPRQIASVTYLSQQEAETPLWRQARRFMKNDGSLVSMAALKPDLVVDMGTGGRDKERIAGRLGIRILNLPYPNSLSDMKGMIRSVAAAIGRRDRGELLVGRIASLERTAPRVQADTIWLGGGGRTIAPTGLGAEWMALAGFRQRAVGGDRVMLEQLLVSPPHYLLRSDYRAGQYSGEQRWLSHPLARGSRRSRTIVTDGRLWTCMGPTMVDERLRLRKESRS